MVWHLVAWGTLSRKLTKLDQLTVKVVVVVWAQPNDNIEYVKKEFFNWEKQKRIAKARKVLKKVRVNMLSRTFFSEEKVLKVQDYRNSESCHVYAPYDQKREWNFRFATLVL